MTKVVILFEVKDGLVKIMMQNSFEFLEKIWEQFVSWVRAKQINKIFNLHDIVIDVSAGLKMQLMNLAFDT